MRHGQTLRPRGQSENVVRGQGDVQQRCLDLGHRHGLAVDGDGGRFLHVARRGHTSVIRLQSSHSPRTCCTRLSSPRRISWCRALPCTTRRRRAQTAQPCRRGPSTQMRHRRSPKGFWALGVSRIVVHSAARLLSSFFAGTAPAVGAPRQSATATSNRIRVRRDRATGTRLLIRVTIVTEVNIAIYDSRSEPTRDRVATQALAGLDARRRASDHRSETTRR